MKILKIFIPALYIFSSISFGLFSNGTLVFAQSAGANEPKDKGTYESPGGPSLVPVNGKEEGNYGVDDFILVFVLVSQWILILSGSLALLAFIIGGLMFILSAGNKELVEKGKSSVKGAVIGLLIVLFAFTAIDFFMTKIGYTKGASFGEWNKVD